MGGYFSSDINNFHTENITEVSGIELLGKTTLLTFWGFIGLESATANAHIVDKPDKVVPIAVTYGTLAVAILYCMNSAGIIGVVPNDILINSSAPYVDASSRIFGGNFNTTISVIAFLACAGTLNAWILTGGQIAYGAAKEGLFPEFFGRLNDNQAPFNALMVAFVGTIPLLVMTISDNLISQINIVIDAAATAFLGIYVICMLSFIKLYYKTHKFYTIIAFIGSIFCLWVIFYSHWLNLLLVFIIVLSGLPVYLFQRKL
ncbi:MAG UNVERIFIED_CONTAM: amino acid permease [Rickettsiaceae bacterium]